MTGLTREEKLGLLKELEEALFTGAKRIRFRERDVTYRSTEEMRQALADLKASLSGKKRANSVLASFSRGY